MSESFPLSDDVKPEEAQLLVGIDHLPEMLGFAETPELRTLRDELIRAVADNESERFAPLESQYERLGREVLGQPLGIRVDEDDYEAAKPRIGLKLAQALVWRDAGRLDYYGLDLYDAQKAAKSRGFKELASHLGAAMLEIGIQPEKPTYINPDNQPEMPDETTEQEFRALSHKFEGANLPIKEEMHRNVLYVNDKILEPTDDDVALWQALTEGKDEIRHGLGEFREYMKKLIPDAEITLAPFEVMFLGKKKQKVLTEFGINLKEDVIYNHLGVKEELQPFWSIVRASGYVPEIRVQTFKYSGLRVGLWARLPETVGTPEREGNV